MITQEEVIQIIVCCRRKSENYLDKYKILQEALYNEELSFLNTRWIVSVCDTVVDLSTDEGERIRALIIPVFVNTLKFAYTAEKMLGETKVDENACKSMKVSYNIETWDGMTTLGLNPDKGNASYNLFRRMNNILIGSPFHSLLHKVFKETEKDGSIFDRINKVHGNFYKHAYNKKFIETPTDRYKA